MQSIKRIIQVTVCFIALAWANHVIAGEGDNNPLISISMMMEAQQPEAGSTQDLALMMVPKKGWHGYWSNPGDAGFPTQFDWMLPEGVTIGDVKYPAPSQLVTSGIMNYIYHGEYVLLAPLTIDKGLAKGTALPIKLNINYLACNPEGCLPEQQTIEITLTVGEGGTAKDKQSTFNQWRQKLPRPLDAQGEYSIENDTFTLSIPLPSSIDTTHAHVYPLTNTIVNNATQTLAHNEDVFSMQTEAGDVTDGVFKGVLVLESGIALSFDAHKTVHSVSKVSTDINATHQRTWLIGLTAFFGAILGGLILNIMPCVFPILSLKILSLSHQGSERETKLSAIAYTLGAVLVCVVLGGVILGVRALGHQIGWAFQLQSPAVIATLIVLMSGIGFNLAGLFEIGTLTSGFRLQDKKGLMGDFWTGVLAAFIATPCTGPFMATALGAALVLPISIAFGIFAGLGLGMALPFLLVGFIPKLRTRLPKPGEWMNTARRVLSLPMFITVLGLVWVLMSQSNDNYVLSVLAVIMLSTFGLWLTGLRQKSQHSAAWWPAILLTLLPLLAVVYGVPSEQPTSLIQQEEGTHNIAFNSDELKALRSEQDVFVYFTADWCLTCKVNEKIAIDRAEVQAAFKQNDIAVMVGDWTNGGSLITHFLSQHGRSGVPLYLWYKKGTDNPIVLPQILSPAVLIDHVKYPNRSSNIE